MTERELLNIDKFRRKIELGVLNPVSYIYSNPSSENMERLYKYADMWERLRPFRKRSERFKDYTYGKQWNDLVEVEGRLISEETNIMRQGKAPLKNNMIRQLCKSVLGAFRDNKTEPQAVSHDRDEQELGELMTTIMQVIYQKNDLHELDARELEEFLISGFAMQCVRYKWDHLRLMKDVSVDNINRNMVFFNGDICDPRGRDVNCIGILSDMTIGQVVGAFARNREDAFRIIDLYDTITKTPLQEYDAFDSSRYKNADFFKPTESNKVRVIEGWELQSKERLRCHDWRDGAQFVCEVTDEHYILEENDKRRNYYISHGVTPENAEKYLISYEWFWDNYWYVYYMTPRGDVLCEMETPFNHKEHPFAMLAYPLVDGEIHSFVEDVIDQQRYINRLITLIDFVIGSSAKGVLVFPEDALGDMTKEEVLQQWVKYNGVIFAKMKPGMPMPQQITANTSVVGATELLNLQMKLMADISGVHGAMQGRQALSGTAASLYAQESQNAAVNLLDLFESFASFRMRRDYKMMYTAQQYYDKEKYEDITGTYYGKYWKHYTPDKIRKSDFDLKLSETMATPAYRMAMNNFLMQIYQMGQVDLKTLLQNSAYPFADKLISSLEKREKEMAEQQQAAAAAQMAGQQGIEEASQEAEAAADPQAMQMINQYLGGQQ